MFQKLFSRSRAPVRAPAKPLPVKGAFRFKTAAGQVFLAIPVGEVEHFYDRISVMILTLARDLRVGEWLLIKGASTRFTQRVESMEQWKKKIVQGRAGDDVGIQVKKPVNIGDKIYKCLPEK